MITYAKLINWREYGEVIILECLAGEEVYQKYPLIKIIYIMLTF